jgi:hypothetical protein
VAERLGRQGRKPVLGPGLLRPLGVTSAALLVVSLGGAAFGVADRGARATGALPPHTAVAPASDAVAVAVPDGTAKAAVAHAGATTPTPVAPAATAAGAARASGSPTPAAASSAHAPLARSTPIQLAVPSIALTAPLLGLGVSGTGQPELPPFSQPGTAGWLRDSATPGEAGTSVLVGHVDTRTGPAVFWSLSAVKPGAMVEVARLDGGTALFTVDQVRTFPKSTFPSAQVYAPAPDAQLRIITCGGAFDRARSEYTGNVVVFAHLSGVREG